MKLFIEKKHLKALLLIASHARERKLNGALFFDGDSGKWYATDGVMAICINGRYVADGVQATISNEAAKELAKHKEDLIAIDENKYQSVDGKTAKMIGDLISKGNSAEERHGGLFMPSRIYDISKAHGWLVGGTANGEAPVEVFSHSKEDKQSVGYFRGPNYTGAIMPFRI